MEEQSVQAVSSKNGIRNAPLEDRVNGDHQKEDNAADPRQDGRDGSENLDHSYVYISNKPRSNTQRSQAQERDNSQGGYPARWQKQVQTQKGLRRKTNLVYDEEIAKERLRNQSRNSRTKIPRSESAREKYSVPKIKRTNQGRRLKIKHRLMRFLCCHANNQGNLEDRDRYKRPDSSDAAVSIIIYTNQNQDGSASQQKKRVSQSDCESFKMRKDQYCRCNFQERPLLRARQRLNETKKNTDEFLTTDISVPTKTDINSKDFAIDVSDSPPSAVKFDLRIDADERFYDRLDWPHDSTPFCQFYEESEDSFDFSSQESIPGLMPRLTRANRTRRASYRRLTGPNQSLNFIEGKSSNQDHGSSEEPSDGQTESMNRDESIESVTYRAREKESHLGMRKNGEINNPSNTNLGQRSILKQKRKKQNSNNNVANTSLTSQSYSEYDFKTNREFQQELETNEINQNSVDSTTILNDQYSTQNKSLSSSSTIESLPSSSQAVELLPSSSNSTSPNSSGQGEITHSQSVVNHPSCTSPPKPCSKCSRGSRRSRTRSSPDPAAQRASGNRLSQQGRRPQMWALVRGIVLAVLAIVSYVFILVYFFV